MSIPKHIWTYWHSRDMPPMITKCIETWKENNADYQITVIHPDTYIGLTPQSKELWGKIKKLFQARIADYVRLDVLAHHGGIWIDASCICTESLQWVMDRHKATGCEMIAFWHWTTTDAKHPVVENYFIACVPGSRFVRDWNRELQSALTYKSEEAYVEYVKQQGIDMQNLEQMLPYLLPYLCSTYVQQRPRAVYALELSDSFRGPYKYMKQHNWNIPNSLQHLCEHPDMQTPLIKMHNLVRKHIDDHGVPRACSHRDRVHPSIRHVLSSEASQTNKSG